MRTHWYLSKELGVMNQGELSLETFLKRVNLGFDFDREPYEVLAPIWVEQYLIHSVNSPLQDGVNEALCLFEELGLVSFDEGKLTVYRGVKAELGDSKIYRKVCLLQES